MEDQGSSHFQSDKTRVLTKVDLSRKGSVDEPIRDLVEYINAQDSFYTTSSCSGRLTVFREDMEQRKKHCSWLLVSHEEVDLKQLVSSLYLPESTPQPPVPHPPQSPAAVPHLPQSPATVPHPPQSPATVPHPPQSPAPVPHPPRSTEQRAIVPTPGYAFFKFEPFILHAMCKSLSDAQTLLQVAVSSGFRNSGITFGRKGKIMLAVRSTHSLEVPLSYQGKLIVTQEYLQHLLTLGNTKLRENKTRIDRFYSELRKALEAQRERLGNAKQGVSAEKHHGNNLEEACSPLTSRPVEELDVDIGLLFR